MNENHQRHLLASFRRIDDLLGYAGHILDAADAASLFTEYTQRRERGQVHFNL